MVNKKIENKSLFNNLNCIISSVFIHHKTKTLELFEFHHLSCVWSAHSLTINQTPAELIALCLQLNHKQGTSCLWSQEKMKLWPLWRSSVYEWLSDISRCFNKNMAAFNVRTRDGFLPHSLIIVQKKVFYINPHVA